MGFFARALAPADQLGAAAIFAFNWFRASRKSQTIRDNRTRQEQLAALEKQITDLNATSHYYA